MTEFEKQLRQAAEQQQAPTLGRNVWLNIQDQFTQQQQQQRFRRQRRQWSVAASFLVLCMAASWLFFSNVDQERLVLQHYDLEQYQFPEQIAQKRATLTSTDIPVRQVEHFEALKSQLEFLDQQYLNYLDYIEQHGYQAFIGKQIQHYYEVKIELLETIQDEIERLNKKNHERNEQTQRVDWQI